jgi:hypothetical protein
LDVEVVDVGVDMDEGGDWSSAGDCISKKKLERDEEG